MEIAIIGGGASGIVAAIAARKGGASVTIYEGCERIGRKILATGNGRCNMTNINASSKNYYGEDSSFVKNIIEQFWVEDTLEFFTELGILYKVEDEGKVYPYSDRASDVLDVLRMRIAEDGIVIRSRFEVSDIIKNDDGFEVVSYKGEKAFADRVIIACGGKAAPSLGSNGSGYDILKKLGHNITSLRPSLVQLKTETEVVKKLKGIKLNAKLTIGEYSEKGELLFTEYGLSGPPVFSLTSRLDTQEYACVDIMPDYSSEQVEEILYTRMALFPERPLEEFFVGMLNKRVGQALLKSVGIAPLSRKSVTLSENEISNIVSAIKNWNFRITGTMSWNNAQVTKGGVRTSEFDANTLESKKIKGLYACGEILDIDGDCGGYNLQWAWSSGYIAGINAGEF